ncbi:MAG: multidrug efflux SMR transporter [Candidatus Binatia bacterium]
MAWILLLIAALVDIAMAIALKYTQGWTRFWPSLLGIVFANGAIFLLTLSLKSLPVGTAFAVFTGIGAAGIALVGILFFQESTSPACIISISMILTGIIALKLLEA